MKKKTSNRIAALFLSLVLVMTMSLSMTACKNKNTDSTTSPKLESTAKNEADTQTVYPLTFKDSAGVEILIEKAPGKVITLGPNLTEIVFALGKGESLVGRTSYDDYPAEALKVESIGEISKPPIEKIVELKPDILFASGLVYPDVVKQLRDLGIKVVSINDQDSFDGVYQTILDMGKILNSNVKSTEIVKGMQDKVASVLTKVKDAAKPKVYFVVGYGQYGEYTATGDTFLGKMLEMAGGSNIAKDATGWKYNLEDIVVNNPDLILCSNLYDSKAGILKANGYIGLDAVKNGKVLEIDDSMVNRQGPRLADGLELLAKSIHPELFK